MKYLLLLSMTLLMSCTQAESKDSDLTLSANNTISLEEDFNPMSTAVVMQTALEMDAKLPKGKPIYLILETPGGLIDAGQNMITMLNGLNRPVHTVTIFAASMGFQTVQNLGDRLILPQGTLMSHHARGGMDGEFGGSSGSQLEKRIKMITDMVNTLDKKTVERTKGKKTLDQYQAEYENELWISGEEAVKEGYADKVVLPKCDRSLAGTKETSVSLFGGLIKVELTQSKCPLVRGILGFKVLVKTKNNAMVALNEFESSGGTFGACPAGPVQSTCLKNESITKEMIDQKVKEAIEKTTLQWKKSNILKLNTMKF